jgi:acyl-CoA thioesterase-1
MKQLKLLLLLFSAVCLAACKKLPLADQAAVITQATPAPTPTVVILGSSTAEGIGANPIDSSWAYRVQATVNQNGVKANFVNLAFGGYTTYQAMPTGYSVSGRPAPDTARNITKALSYHPALVIIDFPSNDIAANYTGQEIVNNYNRMTHMLDSAKVQYIIFSTQPRDFSDPNQRMRLKTLNDTVKSLYTYHVNDFLDQLSTATYSIKPEYEAGDGVHVNNAGHLVIFNATMKQSIFISVCP